MTPQPASVTETTIQNDSPEFLKFVKDSIPALLDNPHVSAEVKYHAVFTLLPTLNHYLNN